MRRKCIDVGSDKLNFVLYDKSRGVWKMADVGEQEEAEIW